MIVATIIFRVGRDLFGDRAYDAWGVLGWIALGLVAYGLLALWRLDQRRRIRRRGGEEFTEEQIVQQLADSGLEPPAFEEDGTLLGAGVFVMNQRAKVLEINTEYEVFGWTGRPLGVVRQVGQTKAKQLVRLLTPFDQLFTHHFAIDDEDSNPVLRLTRPRKLFLTKVHVHDDRDQLVGTIRQHNVFGKIRFVLENTNGHAVGHLRAENLRAWDFAILDAAERRVGSVVKSWEGWTRTAFTRADRYAVRIDQALPDPLRTLAIAGALAVDLALKQDPRGVQ